MNDSFQSRLRSARAPLLLGVIFILGLIAFQEIRSGTAPRDLVAWQTSIGQAAPAAARENRPILIDFGASWCPACQWMEANVWSDPAIAQEIAQNYVPLLADVDKPDGGKLSKQYKIEYLPTILIVSPDGNVIKGGSTMDKIQMLQFLREGAWTFTHEPATQ